MFYSLRDKTTPLSQGFVYLVIVVSSTAVGGLGPGIAASLLGFVVINFLFIPPYETLSISKTEDLIVLFVFLGLSVLFSAVLARAKERAEAAESREAEVRMLLQLSRALVTQPPGRETFVAALRQLVETFGFSSAVLLVPGAQGSGLHEYIKVSADQRPQITAATSKNEAVSKERVGIEKLPLSMGARRVGLVVIENAHSALTPAEGRVLRAFCDQLALILERDRLQQIAAQADEYRRSEDARRSLLGAVSHELRSPLAAIKASATDLLGEDAPKDPAYTHEVLEAVNAEADRLNELIANLLDMSRVESGTLTANIQTCDLEDILSDCVLRSKRAWPTVRFALRIPPNLGMVKADPLFLERVVINLLENAARSAADANHRIDVEPGRKDGRITVRVIDHGKGVPRESRQQIFEPFHRVTDHSSRLGPGLGLAICKGFLNAMGGEIWVEETPGGGATFGFSVPAAKER